VSRWSLGTGPKITDLSVRAARLGRSRIQRFQYGLVLRYKNDEVSWEIRTITKVTAVSLRKVLITHVGNTESVPRTRSDKHGLGSWTTADTNITNGFNEVRDFRPPPTW
jgi:hypothetical protein